MGIFMNPETNVLQDLLRRARSRRQLLLSLRGVAISLGVVAVLLLLTGSDESPVPGRKQRLRNARRRQRYATFAIINLRRRGARQLADLYGSAEVGTKREHGRRRSISDTNNARSFAQSIQH